MLSFSQVKSAGSAGNYYTEKDNYYVIGSMEERWQGKGAEALGLEGKVDKQVFTELLQGKLPGVWSCGKRSGAGGAGPVGNQQRCAYPPYPAYRHRTQR